MTLSLNIGVFAQMKELQSKNKKALKHFNAGKTAYESKNDELAIVELKKAIEADALFIDPYIILGTIYYDAKDFLLAIDLFKKAIGINPSYTSSLYYSLGSSLLKTGQYEQAIQSYKALFTFGRIHPEIEKLAKRDLINCEFGANAIKSPVPFNPLNLGPSVNTAEHEYFPAVTTDEKLFLFTRNRRDERALQGGTQEDFYISIKQNELWKPAFNMGPPINTALNEGAPSLSADGNILVFTACEMFGEYGPGRKGYGSCDIFYSRKNGDNWSKPLNMGQPVNSSKWESQPSFSSDGKSLYFLSSRAGGFGESDIWMSQINEKGEWSNPVNLGAKINTPLKEESVFIHPDNQTLYFASNGHPGMGGTDLYISRKDENGQWGTAVNLGYPINTHGDENSLLVGASGEIAYFASDREGGFGGLDIYSFEMPVQHRPLLVTYFKGKVFDNQTKRPLEAMFELIDLETGNVIVESFSNPGNGEFLVSLPINKDYALNVSKGGYLFYSENFALKEKGTATKPVEKDIPLQGIKEGEIVVLKNVFFATASAELKEESKVELNKLVTFLTKNPSIKIEIGGHTDNVGDKKSNINLSNDRGKSVYNFLISNNVSADRLSFKGYGDAVPVADNSTPEGRALNRRTEFKVLSK
ncbi:MAG: OmpA family protein [Bacteroidota bacterium]|nr:OmpA family protein [Bacteroidota bacterium]